MLWFKVVRFVRDALGRFRVAVAVCTLPLGSGCGRIGYDVVDSNRGMAFHDADASFEASAPLEDSRAPFAEGSGIDAQVPDARVHPDARAPIDASDREPTDARGAVDDAADVRTDAAVDAAALSVGLVALWKFDEGTGGIAADSSGNGNDGVLEAFSQTDWATGYRGRAVDVGYAWMESSYTSSLDSITTATTIAAWVNPHLTVAGSGAPTGTGTVLQRRMGATDAAHFSLRLQDGHVEFSGSGMTPCTSRAAVPVRTWTHVGVASDGATVFVYINGRIDVQCPAPVAFAADTTAISVGAALRTSGMSDGLFATVDEVALFNRALTALEVSAVAAGRLR
jgi:hypothetical protein